MTTNFSCSISERPTAHGFTVRRFEFPGGLLPPLEKVEELGRQVPGLTGPISYLLGRFIARVEDELQLPGYEQWTVSEVKPVLESRDDAFALFAVEVTFKLHLVSGDRVLNVAIVKQAAAWAGVVVDPVELLRITTPRAT